MRVSPRAVWKGPRCHYGPKMLRDVLLKAFIRINSTYMMAFAIGHTDPYREAKRISKLWLI